MGKRQLTIRIPGPMPSDPWTEIVVDELYVLDAYAYLLHASGEKQLVIRHPLERPFSGVGIGHLRLTIDVAPPIREDDDG